MGKSAAQVRPHRCFIDCYFEISETTFHRGPSTIDPIMLCSGPKASVFLMRQGDRKICFIIEALKAWGVEVRYGLMEAHCKHRTNDESKK